MRRIRAHHHVLHEEVPAIRQIPLHYGGCYEFLSRRYLNESRRGNGTLECRIRTIFAPDPDDVLSHLLNRKSSAHLVEKTAAVPQNNALFMSGHVSGPV